ncbi:hypothetical protein GCM10027589_38040 [Actinocorallia lasiicapitis]
MSELVGFTSGLFDLFQIGDLDFLSRAKQQCDRLVVGVGNDELGYCHVPFTERAEIVRNVRYVDDVVELDRWELPAEPYGVVILPAGRELDVPEGVHVIVLDGLRETASGRVRRALGLDAPAGTSSVA